MVHKDSPDFEHDQRMSLDSHVLGGDDQFRFRIVQVCAFRGHHAIGPRRQAAYKFVGREQP